MKKFFLYSLGVLNSISMLSVNAVEKFEVLPDLPASLSYAVSPAQAATISGSSDVVAMGAQSIGNEPSIISVVFSLAFVVLLIYLTGIIYAKLNKVGFKTLKRQQGDFASSQVAVVSTTQLGNNKTLHVVELDGKRMLIGASSSTIQLIKDLGSFKSSEDDEEYSHIEIPNIKIPKIEIPKIEIPSINFSKLVTKTHKPMGNFEEEAKEEIEEPVSFEEKNVVENSEGIIDSLFSPKDDLEHDVTEVSTINDEHKVDPEDFALYKKYLS